MADENSRTTATARSGQRRYHDGDYNQLSEVSDPTTREDETQESLTSTLARNKLVVVGALIALAILALVAREFLPGLASNPYVQVGALAVGMLATGLVVGLRKSLHRAQRVDELVLDMGNQVERYYGTLEVAGDDTLQFTPAKGFSSLGSLGDAYTVNEIDSELARMQQRANRDPDADAKISIDPVYAGVQNTDTGSVVSVSTSGLELDQFGNETVLRTAAPNRADDEALQNLQDRIKNQKQENRSLQTQLQAERRRRKDAEEEVQKKRSEIMDEFTEHFSKIAVSTRSTTQQQRQHADTGGIPPTPSTEEVMQDVAED